MPKKIKHELFKGPIMATVKVLGMYSGLPTYGIRIFFFQICFGLPFVPIFIYGSKAENLVPFMFLVIYFICYLFQTFFLGRYISKIGKQWSYKEYKKLSSDQITFPFIFALLLYGLFHFILFISINEVLYYL